MLRALYSFNSSDQGSLSANQDDLFCGMGVDSSKLWMQVIDEKGAVGFLPTNYLEFCNWVDEKFILHFMDDAVENIHTMATVVGKYTSTQHEQLRLLIAHRTTVTVNFSLYTNKIKQSCVTSNQKRNAPPPPERTNHSTSTTGLANQNTASSSVTNQSQNTISQVNQHPVPGSRSSENSSSAQGDKVIVQSKQKMEEQKTSACSPDLVSIQLTEILRSRTGLSHKKCKIGVSAILECLQANNVTFEDLSSISHCVQQAESTNIEEELEISSDIVEMDSIFESISECKNDSQQRSWHLHDDEYYIQSQLGKLLDILTSGNRDVLVAHIRKDVDCIHNLVLYYQMETRSPLRAVMLQIFAALCTMSAVFITTLLYTVLTLELVRDLMSTEDEQRLTYSAIVLSMLFSTGEQIPVNYNEILSSSFVDFLLDKIENSDDHKISDVSVEVLLSFNQHYSNPEDNLVLQQLTTRQEASILTQNLIKLLNKGEDPCRVIPNEEQMSSVLKFAIDLYSIEGTSQLIYTNDVKVLIDIIIRQLNDLSDTDKLRSDFLSLMQLLIKNADYKTHNHRHDDLLSALNQIEFDEDSTTQQSEMDGRIAHEIRKLLL